MPKLGNVLDFAQLEAQNLRVHNLTSAPSTPVKGQLWYDSTPGVDTLKWWDGATWQSAKAGTGGPPTGTAGGDLSGTYPNPGIATGVIVDGDVNAGAAIAESKLNLATDAAVGTGSRRTLGFGALQAMPGNKTLDQIALTNPASAAVGMNSKQISSLADPTLAQDAATKNYVDLTAQGLDAKQSCFLATTANIASITGTLSATIDGVSSVFSTQNNNRRVLVKDQTAQAENGIYTITNIVAGTSYKLTRAIDMDNWSEVPGAFTFIEEGTANADTGWVCTSDALTGGVPRVLGTDAMVWVQFSAAGSAIAGNGLTKTGNTIDVVPGVGLSVGADVLFIGPGQVADAMLTTPKASYYSSAANPAAATWTITQATHGCRASRGLIVQVRDEASGAWELPDNSVAANGDVTITWAVAQSGNTKRVIITG